MRITRSRTRLVGLASALAFAALLLAIAVVTADLRAATAAGAIVTVNSTDDDADATPGDESCDTGQLNAAGAAECTLRAAIAEANASATIDTIHFDIPTADAGHASGVWTIAPANVLPIVTQTVTIDGTTQPGTSVNTQAFPAPLDSSMAIGISGSLLLGGDADGLKLEAGSDGSTIRGLSIAGFDNSGSDAILIFGSSSHVIAGNHLGVDPAGTTAIANTHGVWIDATSTGVRIGGTDPADRNIISASSFAAINLASTDVSGTKIWGNEIGLLAGGSTASNGTYGVRLNGATGVEVGGVAAGAGNRVTGFTRGVVVSWGSGSILGNHIWGNTGEGIDLGDDGLTANDSGDGDSGPNDFLNYPVITSAAAAGGTATVDLTLDVPAGSYRIEAFTNPSGADASGIGEGEIFEAAQSITHTGSGAEAFQLTYSGTGGDVVTLTTTQDLGGGTYGATSELSAAASVQSSDVKVNSTDDDADASAGDGSCDTGQLNATGAAECTLRAAVAEANASAAIDTIHFDIPTADAGHASGVWRIEPASELPPVTAPVTIDASTQPGTTVNTAGFPAPLNSALAIWLAGDLLSGLADQEGLRLDAGSDGSEIRGLAITGFDGSQSEAVAISASSGHVIAGNHLGVDPAGTVVAPNLNGIWVGGGASATRIGGATAADRNVISGNTNGVLIQGPTTSGMTLHGNEIGVLTDGSTAGNSGAGVLVMDGASGNSVGGASTGEGNRITGSASGVVVGASTADAFASIVSNHVWANTGLGIDLLDDGVTANDAGDADSGPNDLLNYPVIVAATADGGTVAVDFTLDVPAGDYRIEAFANPVGADSSGNGEGQILVGTELITHAGAGSEAFQLTYGGSIGDTVTLTATESLGGGSYGSTSELSAAVLTTSGGQTAVDSSARRSDLVTAGGLDLSAPGPGVAGDGIDVGGGSERLVGPATDLTSGQLTLSAWVRLDTAGTDPRVLAKAASDGDFVYELLVDDATQEAVARLSIATLDVEVGGGAVTTGSWHFLAATWDGSTLALYVDGVPVASGATGTGLATDVTVPLAVGNLAAGDRGLDGAIDHVQVLHAARSPAWLATAHANISDPGSFVTIGAEQTGVPAAWSTSTAQARTGAASLAAPTTAAGADAWLTATGLDEPGTELESWWRLSDPASAEVAAGTRTGAVPTDQYETALTSSGFDLATLLGLSRTQIAAPAGAISPVTWTKVVIATDELGQSTVSVGGTTVTGPATHSGGAASGSVGLRAGVLPGGETWHVDDVQIRRLVSDEPTTTLGALDRD